MALLSKYIKLRVIGGDTFYGISAMTGMSRNQLLVANPSIKNRNVITINSFLNVFDSSENRKIAATRELAYNSRLATPMDNQGHWGVYPKLGQDITAGAPQNETPIVVDSQGFSFSNPWILGGIAVIAIAALMGKR